MDDLHGELRRRGWKLVYVPHEVIRDYNACYNVLYEGRRICPPAGERLGIPLNEIWISERWRKYEKYILYHELREIEYRAMGYDVEEAHWLAERDCVALWRADPIWREMVVEIHISDVENMCGCIGDKKI
jgi:competence protein ComEA